MQVYVKLYLGQGVGNYYSLDGDDTTLRGLFVVYSGNKESKKLKSGFWKSICPVSCSVDCSVGFTLANQKVNIMVSHSYQMGFECESKYYGTLKFFSSQEKKVHQGLTVSKLSSLLRRKSI